MVIIRTLEQSFHRDVFIKLFPMDADAAANQSAAGAVLRGGLAQAGEPLQRDRDLPAIRQKYLEGVIAELYGHRAGFLVKVGNSSPLSP